MHLFYEIEESKPEWITMGCETEGADFFRISKLSPISPLSLVFSGGK